MKARGPYSEKQPLPHLNAAHKLLSDARLCAFFHAAAAHGAPTAVCIFSRELKAGRTLDELARMFNRAELEHGGLRMSLKVRQLSPCVFHITFGLAGGGVGDGGEWRVTFSRSTRVLRAQCLEIWIA